MQRNSMILVVVSIVFLLVFIALAWAPWLDGEEIHDMVLRERAHKDGTYGRIVYPNGTERYGMICDYNVIWVPFGRWVASCEGAYYVNFWGQVLF